MTPKHIPSDINVEILLRYLCDRPRKVEFKGVHKRNAYLDIIDAEEKEDGALLLSLGRHSLYDSLPEYMFHPMDRFSNIRDVEKKERFEEEEEKQTREISNATRFFYPVDVALLHENMEVGERLERHFTDNHVLISMIADRLHEEQTENRYIRLALTFLPMVARIRGNRTLLTIMLRKILVDDDIVFEGQRKWEEMRDVDPKYDTLVGDCLDALYAGNIYDEKVTSYSLTYWPSDEADLDRFPCFLEELEIFRKFVQDYFMSVEEMMVFVVRKDCEPLVLDDAEHFFMNYNTNI